MESLIPFADQWLGLIIDIILIFAFVMLWLSWHRNGRRQEQLERMLAGTAAQLEEATRHLTQATEAIEQLQSAAQAAEAVNPVQNAAARRSSGSVSVRSERQSSGPAAGLAEETKFTAPQADLPSRNSSQVTMMLRMKREGESAQTIAERLDMPLAQVRLLLKLHAATGAANEQGTAQAR